jgi:mannose-1-phosphate guanylyltransferase
MGRYAMIMAGGQGTRLWPMSRADRPKQLLRFIPREGGEPTSLLELAALRLTGLIPDDHRYICTGERFRRVIRDALGLQDQQILGEPMGRDTLNAVGFAAAIIQKRDPDGIFCVLTADHLINPESLFRDRVDLAYALVEEDPSRLITFGIQPDHPATGFGYIERGERLTKAPASVADQAQHAFEVARFVEKPDLSRAQAYVESGDFLWNSGMFVFHAGTFMDLLKRHKPESYEGLTKVADAWGTPEQQPVLEAVYPSLPKISVDYAIMEPAAKDESVSIIGIEAQVSWLDVGSWPSYGATLTPDDAGNRVAGAATTTMHDSGNNLVVTEDVGGHHIALLGVEDLIVVHTRDATLIMPKDRAQDLKDLHAQLDPKHR